MVFTYTSEAYAAICGDNLDGCPSGQSCWKKETAFNDSFLGLSNHVIECQCSTEDPNKHGLFGNKKKDWVKVDKCLKLDQSDEMGGYVGKRTIQKEDGSIKEQERDLSLWNVVTSNDPAPYKDKDKNIGNCNIQKIH